ncbi:NAD(P)-dependent oxidoreductase [Ancylobacter lacus]|uniref:NAD(P)-dependent oxidoreductase n=1 Tax=Ancylobacter lacus TaxID=2579970 RepID=UPI001BD1A94D|nr:NAD(P)H-binding protein [Ancylobacter lacus]MBS7537681.1 NAD(P)H-binding protein [Ancylobacter lacus]
MTSLKKITVVGGTGYAGSAILREAAKRGHAVTAISRSVPAETVEGVTHVAADLLRDTLPLGEADVVVGAVSPRAENAGTLAKAYAGLAGQARQAGARLVLVGGFSCLRRTAGGPRMIEAESFPPEVPEAVVIEAKENMEVLSHLLADTSGLDWLFVSPAMEFSSWMPGEDLGRYRVGDEVALFDADGRSAISGPDYARAVLDEIEHPTRHRAQIGVAY